jgi:hypothetical protein
LVTERGTVLTALLPVIVQAINKIVNVEISNYCSKYLRMNQVLVMERYCAYLKVRDEFLNFVVADSALYEVNTK